MMPVADATKEPRRAKCRPPSEAELAAATEEASKASSSEQTAEQGTEVEGEMRREGSGEPEEVDELEEESPREEGVAQKAGEEESPRKTYNSNLGKRLRSRLTDGEDPQRARKLRPRNSLVSRDGA